MFTKSTRWLLVAVLALAGFIVWVERRQETTEQRRRMMRRALRLEADRVRRLKLESEGFQAVMVRDGERWTLTDPVRTPADEDALGRILLALERLPRGETLRAEEWKRAGQTLADFGLDPPRLRLTVEADGPPLVLRVGRPTPLADAVYLLVEGTDEVMTTSPGPLSLLPNRIEQLRDRSLYGAEATRARRIGLRRADGWTRLQRTEGGTWVLTAPRSVRADATAVRQLLAGLAAARAGEFVQDGPVEPAAYGFDEPAVTVELDAPGLDPEDALLIGRSVPGRPDWWYGRFRRRDSVFTVSATLVAQLTVPANQLRDRRLTPLAPEDVSAVRLEMDDQVLHLARAAEGWTIIEPTRAPAEQERVEALVRSWVGAPVFEFIDPPAAEEILPEFDPPLGIVRLYAKTGEEAAMLQIGRRPPEHGRIRVRVPPETTVYETAAPLLQLLTPDPFIYRGRRLFELEPAAIYRLVLSRGGREQAVRREAGGPFTAEDGSPVDDARLRERLDRLVRARVRHYVTERPANLAPYGLDDPEGTLTLGLVGEAGIGKTVVVGRPTSTGETFAMLRGKDLVFAIDMQTRDDLLADLTLGGGTAPETPPSTAP